MARAPLRCCLGSPGRPRCANLVAKGRCPECAGGAERAMRGNSRARGYTTAWDHFRSVTFPRLLIRAGVPPRCGASLPDGPDTARYSACLREGRTNVVGLHLDHEPPLRPEERADPRAVMDPARVGYLCASCHSMKTRSEMAGGRGRATTGAPPATPSAGPPASVPYMGHRKLGCATRRTARVVRVGPCENSVRGSCG